MFAVERQLGIMNLLKSKKAVTVTELSHAFYIGEASIRRDLDKLERKGLLKRTHGGAVLLDGIDSEIPLSIREIEQKGAKDTIGKIAAQLVADGEVIILDSSSTALKMVQQLKGKKDLTIITNGAKTALELGELPNVKVYSTGGMLRENSLSYIGEHARRFIENYFVDTLFFSCRAVSLDHGCSDVNEAEAELRKVMINYCRKVVLLCDRSKFDNTSFCKISDFKKINCIITDVKPSQGWLDFLEHNQVEVLYPHYRTES